jgi:hypothetical protein
VSADPDDARDAYLHDGVGPRLPGRSLTAEHVLQLRELARDALERSARGFASDELCAEQDAGAAGRLR